MKRVLCIVLTLSLVCTSYPTSVKASHVHSSSCYASGSVHSHTSSCETVSKQSSSGATERTCTSCNGNYTLKCQKTYTTCIPNGTYHSTYGERVLFKMSYLW